MAATNNEPDRIAIDFIDPLFAVVLNVSFAQILLQSWFRDLTEILRDHHVLFYVGTLALAYATVILSWIGYHRSIQTHPISVKSRAGRWRFLLDVLLLVAYFFLVVSYNNFRRELWTLVVIFFLFFGWDQFKRMEWPEEQEPGVARRGVTVFWFLAFLLVALFYSLHPPTETHGYEDWFVLGVTIISTLLYRSHKERLWWKALLLKLGFPKGNV